MEFHRALAASEAGRTACENPERGIEWHASRAEARDRVAVAARYETARPGSRTNTLCHAKTSMSSHGTGALTFDMRGGHGR